MRRSGVAFDDGEFNTEVRCVAVPVRDFTGQVAGAIGLSGPIWRLSIQNLQEKARQVRVAADKLSAEFGRMPQQERRRNGRLQDAARLSAAITPNVSAGPSVMPGPG